MHGASSPPPPAAPVSELTRIHGWQAGRRARDANVKGSERRRYALASAYGALRLLRGSWRDDYNVAAGVHVGSLVPASSLSLSMRPTDEDEGLKVRGAVAAAAISAVCPRSRGRAHG